MKRVTTCAYEIGFRILVGIVWLALTACSGGGGGSDGTTTGGPPPTPTDTGVFKDSNVSGLAFVSGGQSGVTNSQGSFTYEVGRDVTFSVGAVTLSTLAGKPVVTPVDLIPNGTTTSTRVLNITRFLMMLDTDGDPTNGITISDAVQSDAANYAQVSFDAADLDMELSSIVTSVSFADNRTAVLPNPLTAQSHIEATLRCVHSGGYMGTFSGGDSGTFGVVAGAQSGLVVGVAYSELNDELIGLGATSGISMDQQALFVAGSATTGAIFSGQFDTVDTVRGDWENSQFGISGSFSGTRVGGSLNAVYRFVGIFSGDDAGLFTFDINASDVVTGLAYSVPNDELLTLSASLVGNLLSGTTSTGASVSGVLDKSNGTLQGFWSNVSLGGSFAGSFVGEGCKLN